jgi:hypothetical protein
LGGHTHNAILDLGVSLSLDPSGSNLGELSALLGALCGKSL